MKQGLNYKADAYEYGTQKLEIGFVMIKWTCGNSYCQVWKIKKNIQKVSENFLLLVQY